MMKKIIRSQFLSLFLFFLFSNPIFAKTYLDCSHQVTSAWKNDIPPRLQWNENFGYCGEVSMISAGLYYGQYLSQYTARAIASQNTPQYLAKSQLMLGVNDQYAAEKMHLKAIAWDTSAEKNTRQFLTWIKQNVLKGYPVIIGIYTNEYLFYNKKNPKAGDPDFDHIVPVFGIGSHHSLNRTDYYDDDVIYFSDNGLWGNSSYPPYIFSYPFALFQANRSQANAKNGSIYSLSNSGSNYGIAIAGIIDLNGDTLPIRVDTNLNDEKPEIENGTNFPPDPMPLTLIITLSHLELHILYNLYRYHDLELVPDSHFNAHAAQAYEKWQIQIDEGSTFVMTQQIQSDEVAVYRAVKATAP
jgi:hypothetical protein